MMLYLHSWIAGVLPDVIADEEEPQVLVQPPAVPVVLLPLVLCCSEVSVGVVAVVEDFVMVQLGLEPLG